jgi:hypothetical protein
LLRIPCDGAELVRAAVPARDEEQGDGEEQQHQRDAYAQDTPSRPHADRYATRGRSVFLGRRPRGFDAVRREPTSGRADVLYNCIVDLW